MALAPFRFSRPYNGRKLMLTSVSCLFLLWFYLSFSHPYSPLRAPWQLPQGTSVSQGTSSEQWLEKPDLFDQSPLDSEAIRSMCAKTEWNANLTFTCNNSGGGVGNLRNSVLNCVRYAISAGASLTMPRMILRNPANIADIWNRERTSFDYLFDEPHFVESLRISCPQLQLLNGTDQTTDRPSIPVVPEKISEEITPEGIDRPEDWRRRFYEWLGNKTDMSQSAVVDLDRSYLQYPIYSDPEDFALDFGKILKFRYEARVLATTTLRNLVRKYNMHGDFTASIWNHTFFGVHLRTERDSQQGWPPTQYEYSRYETQSTNYLQQAAASGTSVMYVASGNVQEIARFAEDAKAYNLTVTTKHELLDGEDKAKLEAFTFDQQALVDYLVLLKSSDFAGVGHSSFAWNIALWRHQLAKQRDHLNGPQLMSDELSQVYGTVKQYLEYACCLWP